MSYIFCFLLSITDSNITDLMLLANQVYIQCIICLAFKISYNLMDDTEKDHKEVQD